MDVYPAWVTEPVKRYWRLTDREAQQHVYAYMMTDQGKQELRGILIKSGVDPKLIRTLNL